MGSSSRGGRRSPAIALGLLVLLVGAATPVQAGWSVPEGEPYDAPTRVVTSNTSGPRDLDYREGILAWVDTGRSGSGRRGPLVLQAEEGTLPNSDRERISSASLQGADGASHPAVAPTHVAWRDYGNLSGTVQNVGTEIHVLHFEDWRVRELPSPGDRVTPPRSDDRVVTWASQTLGSEDPIRIHRYVADNRSHSSWDSPFGRCELPSVWPWRSGFLLVVRPGMCPPPGGIYAWTPGDGPPTRIVGDDAFALDVDERVTWTAYREGEGRGTNIYLHDPVTDRTGRATFSPGRETASSLDGDRLVWADLRDESRSNPSSTLYFKELRTGNEYRVNGTRGFEAGPVLEGRKVAYIDEDGRALIARLPSTKELVTAQVRSVLHETRDGVPTRINITIDASELVDRAWDRDLDGAFETPGNLSIPVNATGVPALEETAGRALTDDGSFSVVSVDVVRQMSLARRLGNVISGPGGPDERTNRRGEPLAAPGLVGVLTGVGVAAVWFRER